MLTKQKKYKPISPRDRFFRDPHWRMNEARRIVDGSQTSRSARTSDSLVIKLAKYLRAERHLSSLGYTESEVITRLYPDFGPVALACEFWNNRNNLAGMSLQAHLLTELDINAIASLFQLDADVVYTFSSMFFDVRDRLDNVNYISGCVLGPVFQSGIDAINPLLLSKYFGYFGGSLVLGRVLHGLSRTAALSSDDEVLGYLENVTRFNTTLQTAITVTMHQPTRFDLRSLIEGYTVIRSIDKGTDEVQEQSWLADVIRAMKLAREAPRSTVESLAYQAESGIFFNQLKTEPRSFEKQAVIDGRVAAADVMARHTSMVLPKQNLTPTADPKKTSFQTT